LHPSPPSYDGLNATYYDLTYFLHTVEIPLIPTQDPALKITLNRRTSKQIDTC
jgi:hypothetical protein